MNWKCDNQDPVWHLTPGGESCRAQCGALVSCGPGREFWGIPAGERGCIECVRRWTCPVKDVYFFPNGNTAASDGKAQIPELQASWFLLYVDFLIGKGVAVEAIVFHFPLPTRSTARAFKTETGYNWEFKEFEEEKA